MRDDLKLAAYAVACGFTLEIDGGKRPFQPSSFIAGIPHDGLSFKRDATHVWQTARGWRVATVQGGRFPPPKDSDFHKSLLKALEAAQVPPVEASRDFAALGFIVLGHRLRKTGSRGAIEITDRSGLRLPEARDWAVTVWRDDCPDEADTDMQDNDACGDRAAPRTLERAVQIAIERLEQIDSE